MRFVIVASASAYIFWMNGFQLSNEIGHNFAINLTLAGSFIFTFATLAHIIRNPEINYVRRFVGMAHDVFVVTLFFYFGNETAALFFFVYPWTAIGNGFRYGEKWLLISALMSAIGLSFVLSKSPYWSNMSFISAGIAINFASIVTYTGLLLRKLRSTTAKLEMMATHDALTGLPNRRRIMDQLRQTLEFNLKNRRTVACVYFDLDGFKQVNDTLGHGAGDFLLTEVGRRTRAMLRDSDLLARLGGDEFSIVLDSVQSREDAEIICRRVVKVVEDITEVMGHPIRVSVSVGCVIVSPETVGADGRAAPASEEAVMRLADACMYKSKKSGSGKYTIDSFPPNGLIAAA